MIKNLDNHCIAVFGGAGNIGSNIIDYIVDNFSNCKIVMVDNLYNGNKSNLTYAIANMAKRNNNIFTIFDSISKYNKMKVIFESYSPQCVFHQASYLTLDTKKYRQEAIETNIMGFVNILELALQYKTDKVVFASSASVYGNPNTIPTSEKHDFKNNKLLYGTTKIANELIANYYADEEKLKLVGLRYFNVIGPRQSLKNVYTQIVPKWIDAMKKGKDIVIYGNGTQTMDLISAKDIARYNVLAMQNEELYRGNNDVNFEGYLNVGSGKETSVLDLFNIIKNLSEKYGIDTKKSKIMYQEHDPNLVKRRKADVTLLHKYLGSQLMSSYAAIEECVVGHIKNEK